MTRPYKKYTSSIYEGIITALVKGEEVILLKDYLNLSSLQQQFRRLRESWPQGIGADLYITYKPDPDNKDNIILYTEKKTKSIPYTIKPKI